MIYKKTKNKKLKHKDILLILLIIIYIAGVFIGCDFAFKNSRNMAFIQKVTCVDLILKSAAESKFAVYVQYLKRDLLAVCSILILKYSGVLKGLSISVPFIIAVQNSCIYAGNLCRNNFSFSKLFLDFIIKDTSVVMIILLYTMTITTEILNNKYNPRKEIINLSLYASTIAMVYIIDFTVKYFI
ncbi:MAG: hypothetical protein IKY30_04150 [Oscillospiraceae bacterium]|nr:hypothetical protein [Oscillospiraceae bacterium]